MKKIWFVEHPCGADIKNKAMQDGCKVVDLAFKDQYPDELVGKVVTNKKRKKTSKPDPDIQESEA